jgi:hypothetical protein
MPNYFFNVLTIFPSAPIFFLLLYRIYCPFSSLFYIFAIFQLYIFFTFIRLSLYHFFCSPLFLFFLLPSLRVCSLPYWRTWLVTQFLDLSQAVGHLRLVISSPQDLYINTEKRGHTLKIHAHGGIQTRNHGGSAIEDCWLQRLAPVFIPSKKVKLPM